VEAGDTLSLIAALYNSSLPAIEALNAGLLTRYLLICMSSRDTTTTSHLSY
jgi:hypothetical protein